VYMRDCREDSMHNTKAYTRKDGCVDIYYVSIIICKLYMRNEQPESEGDKFV
jgi:hypothetical protein